jgi:hypothetical protein
LQTIFEQFSSIHPARRNCNGSLADAAFQRSVGCFEKSFLSFQVGLQCIAELRPPCLFYLLKNLPLSLLLHSNSLLFHSRNFFLKLREPAPRYLIIPWGKAYHNRSLSMMLRTTRSYPQRGNEPLHSTELARPDVIIVW